MGPIHARDATAKYIVLNFITFFLLAGSCQTITSFRLVRSIAPADQPHPAIEHESPPLDGVSCALYLLDGSNRSGHSQFCQGLIAQLADAEAVLLLELGQSGPILCGQRAVRRAWCISRLRQGLLH